MSKDTSVSDLDYLEESRGPGDRVWRTCTACHAEVAVSTADPYQVQVFCTHCLDKMRAKPAMAKVGDRSKAGAA